MGNYFGEIFRFTSWGESHGKAIGCVIDGCPSLINLTEEDIQPFLDKRKPGQSKFTTQRQEEDRIEILSGVFEGKTTGTPISLIIHNQDQKSKDYGDIKDKFRPSHADYTYFEKYGIRDYRGGGRSSARETAMRVAAGAVARKIIANSAIGKNIAIYGYISQIGEKKINYQNFDLAEINNNDFFCPDKSAIGNFSDYLSEIRKNGDSIGAVIEIIVKNMPVGLGEPIYNKLDAKIASGIMSINAVKSVEIGLGADVARKRGSELADEMSFINDKVQFSSNHSGGIIGGISSGQDLLIRFSVKPTSSILIPRKTIDINKNNTEIITKGRHDPCVGIRAVPVGEAMIAAILADFILFNKIYQN
jgi:chorismate synthase